jgi:hypothetical protein
MLFWPFHMCHLHRPRENTVKLVFPVLIWGTVKGLLLLLASLCIQQILVCLGSH